MLCDIIEEQQVNYFKQYISGESYSEILIKHIYMYMYKYKYFKDNPYDYLK